MYVPIEGPLGSILTYDSMIANMYYEWLVHLSTFVHY